MKSRGEFLTVVSATLASARADALLETLIDRGLAGAVMETPQKDTCRIDLFLAEGQTADGVAGLLVDCAAPLGMSLAPEVRRVRDQDWRTSWRKHFKIIKVSPRLVVRPPWLQYVAGEGEQVLTIEPGMSFGTGSHETTLACLQLLDELAWEGRDRSVLDLGCGSGILSIAAAKLGFAEVRGIDNDTDSVIIARRNAEINGVDLRFEQADLGACNGLADLVVANVLASVLTEHAAAVAGCVRTGTVGQGVLVLSGILDGQYARVAETYRRLGFVERRSLLLGEWRTGCFAPTEEMA